MRQQERGLRLGAALGVVWPALTHVTGHSDPSGSGAPGQIRVRPGRGGSAEHRTRLRPPFSALGRTGTLTTAQPPDNPITDPAVTPRPYGCAMPSGEHESPIALAKLD